MATTQPGFYNLLINWFGVQHDYNSFQMKENLNCETKLHNLKTFDTSLYSIFTKYDCGGLCPPKSSKTILTDSGGGDLETCIFGEILTKYIIPFNMSSHVSWRVKKILKNTFACYYLFYILK